MRTINIANVAVRLTKVGDKAATYDEIMGAIQKYLDNGHTIGLLSAIDDSLSYDPLAIAASERIWLTSGNVYNFNHLLTFYPKLTLARILGWNESQVQAFYRTWNCSLWYADTLDCIKTALVNVPGIKE